MSAAPVASPRIPIRWPFRLCAILILLCASVGIGGEIWRIWQGVGIGITATHLAFLPGIAWFMNILLPAAIYGRVTTRAEWPFASDRVMSTYFILAFLLFLQLPK
jgi:hypothetical protein